MYFFIRIEIPYISVDEYISLNSGNGRSYSRMITTDLVTGKGDRPRNRAVRITGTNQLNVQVKYATLSDQSNGTNIPNSYINIYYLFEDIYK